MKLLKFMALAALVGLIALSARAVNIHDHRTLESIEHNASPDGKTETWIINRPTVTQAIKEYPNIRFQPGDSILVQASGCVQTGGHGLTWKRYVDPSGPNSERLYYGLIWIPGVVGAPWPGMKRFKDINGQTIGVPATVNTAQAYLRLGYIDDGYSDNGYDSPDSGTENQCRDEEKAVVTLTVTHGGPPILPLPEPAIAAFDLLSDTLDDNLMLLNPYWGYQKLHNGLSPSAEILCAVPTGGGFPPTYWPDRPPCTNQPTFRDNSFWCGPHANWGPATVTGPIDFESHSTGHFGDDDYSWYLDPPNGNGLTATRATLEPEFKAAETIDHFSTPWWNDFHTGVDHGGEGPKTMVNGKFAIVSGLFGLDFEHTIHAELHPVFAMAIRVKENPNDEMWVFFVRLFGNEGFCSSNMHYLEYLPNNQFVFRLPLLWGPTATLASQDSEFIAEHDAPPPQVTFVLNQGVLITFNMSENPAARQLIHGELHLHWNNANPSILRSQVAVSRPKKPETKEQGTELYYEELVEKITPAQKEQLSKMVPAEPVERSKVKLKVTHTVAVADKLPPRPMQARRPTVVSVLDPDKVKHDKALVEAIHKITQIPLPPPRPQPVPSPPHPLPVSPR